MTTVQRLLNFVRPGIILEEDEERERQQMALEEIAGSRGDLYGTAHVPHKTAEDVGEALYSLDAELEKIPIERKGSFLEALRTCPDQVDDVKRTAFLWREGFDASLAAHRLVEYWEHKLALFGAEKCFLPLTLKDALKDDMEALMSGLMRFVPAKDAFGRSIVFFDPSRRDPSKYSRESALRACWYILHAYTDDHESQRRGIIFMAFPKHATPHHFDVFLFPMILELENTYLPLRFCSFHICHPDPFFRAVSPIAKFMLGRRLRARLAVHFGSYQEVLEKLLKYGLMPESVPTDMGGLVVMDHMKWISDMLCLEQQFRDSSSCYLNDLAATVLQEYEKEEEARKFGKRRRDDNHRKALPLSNVPIRSEKRSCSPHNTGILGHALCQATMVSQPPKYAGPTGISPANKNWILSGGANNLVNPHATYYELLRGTRSLQGPGFAVGHNTTRGTTYTPQNALLFGVNTVPVPPNNLALSQQMVGPGRDSSGVLDGTNGNVSAEMYAQYMTSHTGDAVSAQRLRSIFRELSLQRERPGFLQQLENTNIASSSDSRMNNVNYLPRPSDLPAASVPTVLTEFSEDQHPDTLQQLPSNPSTRGARSLYLPRVLFLPNDEDIISAHQCLLRRQIEVFEATEEHVCVHARGRNKPVCFKQVGIRCRHCQGLPLTSNQRGSIYFPSTLLGLYQAAQNMSGFHITNSASSCSKMPQNLKGEFDQILACKSTVGGGKTYWAEAAKVLGLVDTPYGIRFSGSQLFF